jgi:hypothetical protein
MGRGTTQACCEDVVSVSCFYWDKFNRGIEGKDGKGILEWKGVLFCRCVRFQKGRRKKHISRSGELYQSRGRRYMRWDCAVLEIHGLSSLMRSLPLSYNNSLTYRCFSNAMVHTEHNREDQQIWVKSTNLEWIIRQTMIGSNLIEHCCIDTKSLNIVRFNRLYSLRFSKGSIVFGFCCS